MYLNILFAKKYIELLIFNVIMYLVIKMKKDNILNTTVFQEKKTFETYIVENKTDETEYFSSASFLIVYCQRGSCVHYINDISSVLNHGDIFIVPPGERHSLKITSRQTVMYVLSFPAQYLISDSDSHNNCTVFLRELLLRKHIYPKLMISPEDIVFFECLLSKIIREWEDKKDYSDEIIIHCLKALITEIFRICITKTDKTPHSFDSKSQFIDYCVSYIDAHCSEDITLNDITKISAMSKAVFCSMFKEKTELTFKEYLNRKRIQKAMALIKSGENITKVSSICGYNELSTFYRNFIKYTNTTPSRYKHNVKKY